MKKLFILVSLVVGMMLFSISSVLAASVYVDYMPGTWELSAGSSIDGDSNAAIIGVEQAIDKFKINLEYTSSQLKDFLKIDYDEDYAYLKDIDFSGFELKGGYQLTDQFSLNLSYLDQELEKSIFPDKIKFSGVMFGAEGNFKVADQVFVNGSLGFSVDGKAKSMGDDTDLDITNAKIKIGYQFTDNFSATVGYRYAKYDAKDLNITFKNYGPTIGGTYTF